MPLADKLVSSPNAQSCYDGGELPHHRLLDINPASQWIRVITTVIIANWTMTQFYNRRLHCTQLSFLISDSKGTRVGGDCELHIFTDAPINVKGVRAIDRDLTTRTIPSVRRVAARGSGHLYLTLFVGELFWPCVGLIRYVWITFMSPPSGIWLELLLFGQIPPPCPQSLHPHPPGGVYIDKCIIADYFMD